MAALQKLIDGYRIFYKKFFIEDHDIYKKLARDGQLAPVAVIACSDSRVDPSIITSADPGDLFVIRNVANLVPPYQPDDSTYHGTSAALEFAINNLQVPHLIVLGHSKCAGIRALMDFDPKYDKHSFLSSWMMIAADARKQVQAEHAHMPREGQVHQCEKHAIAKSLLNLHSFPWISEKIDAGKLKIHGWYFDIDEGKLFTFDEATGVWSEIK